MTIIAITILVLLATIFMILAIVNGVKTSEAWQLVIFWRDRYDYFAERNDELHQQIIELRQLCDKLREGQVKDE